MVRRYHPSMHAFHLIQVSDTHLGRDRPWLPRIFERWRASSPRADRILSSTRVTSASTVPIGMTTSRSPRAVMPTSMSGFAPFPAIMTSATIPGRALFLRPSPSSACCVTAATSVTTTGSTMPATGYRLAERAALRAGNGGPGGAVGISCLGRVDVAGRARRPILDPFAYRRRRHGPSQWTAPSRGRQPGRLLDEVAVDRALV